MTSNNIELCSDNQYKIGTSNTSSLDNDKWNINKCYFKFIEKSFINGILIADDKILNQRLDNLITDYWRQTNKFKEFNNFGYNIIELCNNTIQGEKSLCAPILQKLCKDVDVETVGQQRFCGCYQNTDDVQCSFGCNAPYTIQTTKQCNQQRCIIDNISIQAINSNLKNINISQACAGCTQETPCICYFNASSSDPSIVGATYSKLESNCNASLCAIDGNDISCDLLPTSRNTGSRKITLWIFLIVIGLIIIICLLLSFTSKK